MKYLYALTILLLALILAAFIQQNGQEVVLKYFYWQTVPLPLSLYMIVAFGGGYVLALLVGFASGVRNRVRVVEARREVRQLKREVADLRGKLETPAEEPEEGSESYPVEDSYKTVVFPRRTEEEEEPGEEEEKGES